MEEQKFFKCNICGNFVGMINNSEVPMICCGTEMEEVMANTVEASKEKHIPLVSVNGDKLTVQVGSVLHPALPEHHIEFIYLQTEQGGQRKQIPIGKDPIVEFSLVSDKPIAAFEYCNIHGLWKLDIDGGNKI